MGVWIRIRGEVMGTRPDGRVIAASLSPFGFLDNDEVIVLRLSA